MFILQTRRRLQNRNIYAEDIYPTDEQIARDLYSLEIMPVFAIDYKEPLRVRSGYRTLDEVLFDGSNNSALDEG